MSDIVLRAWVVIGQWLGDAIQDLRDDERGQGMVEYALILVLVAVVAVAVLLNIGTDVRNVFNKVHNCLNGATLTNCPGS